MYQAKWSVTVDFDEAINFNAAWKLRVWLKAAQLSEVSNSYVKKDTFTGCFSLRIEGPILNSPGSDLSKIQRVIEEWNRAV